MEPGNQSEGQVYYRKRGFLDRPLPYVLGGVALVAGAMLGFLAALMTDVSQFQMHFMTTVPMIVAISCFGAAYSQQNPIERIVLLRDRVEIVDHRRTRPIAYRDLSMTQEGQAAMSNRRKLTLFDLNGKAIVTLPDSLECFKDIVEWFKQVVDARQDDQSASVRRRKSKRDAIWAIGGGIGVIVFVSAILYSEHRRAQDEALFQAEAVPGQGIVERHFTAPDGRTRRLEYTITDDFGNAATHNAEVEQWTWDALVSATVVNVTYVPGRPDLTRLAEGEIVTDDGFPPILMWILPIGGYVLAVFMLMAGILTLYGIDIDFDSKTRKFSIKSQGAAVSKSNET